MKAAQIAAALDRFRVTSGEKFRLREHRPDELAHGLIEREHAPALLASGVARLSALQTLLFAEGRRALLVVLQAMDAAGKDGTIKHVMSGVNPQGVRVVAFKVPGPEALAHDFLWRVHRELPARGMIGIFNRSHYEEVLAVRVHPAFLARQHLPELELGADADEGGDAAPEVGKKFWRHRLQDIAAFERYLDRQGIAVLKIFLHVSRDEQKRRFLERLDDPAKNWKFSAADIEERGFWADYMAAYEDAIAETATPRAPWYVVPADRKWFAHVVVMEAIIARLEAMQLAPPHPAAEQRARLDEARAKLLAEGDDDRGPG